MRLALTGMLAAGLLVVSGLASAGQPRPAAFPPGARYVSMGSSYAAGAGIGALVPGSPQRCGRTQNNYAHLLAAQMGLDLVDASCGGATTAHILGPWNELPAQLDAVTPETRLVTVTIGGNDLNYVRNLMVATCGKVAMMTPPAGSKCPAVQWPSDADYAALRQHLRDIARQVHQRAPAARLVFVEYVRIVPDSGTCAQLPLEPAQMAAARELIRRMAQATAEAARAEHAMLLPTGELSRGHEACSADPWGAGYPGKPTTWHPTAAGHAGIAMALVHRLRN